MSDRDFEALGGKVLHEGDIISLHQERFRHADGEEVVRDVVRHDGAAGVVAHDGEVVYLVRQPREAVGDPDVLELPAGRLDHEGESALQTAQRELAEEIGKAAARWEPLTRYWSSVGFTDEEVHVFLATELTDAQADSGENERLEIVRWPLDDLDGAIGATRDAKTLIGLLMLRSRLAR